MYSKTFILLFLVLASSCANQQSIAQTDISNKSRSFFEKGDEARVFGQTNDAIENFNKAIEIEPDYLKAHYLLAQIYHFQLKDYSQAAYHYQRVTEIDENQHNSYYFTASCWFYQGDYSQAENWINKYLSKKIDDEAKIREGQLLKESIAFAKEAKKSPVPFQPINLGPNVNSAYAEYFPSITADLSQLYFTVSNPNDRYPDEDIYVALFENGEWQERESVKGINLIGSNEGAHCITQDGRYLFFASDRKNNNKGRFDIYLSKKIGDDWKSPVNIGQTINTPNWESQPVITADSKYIFYVSSKAGGEGSSDIYYVEIQEKGTFSEPINLGPVINTPGIEQRPYLHPDGKTLYFSSDGHPGMGKADLFKAEWQDDGTWSEPINLGYPINSAENEQAIYVSANGNLAFISSERKEGFGFDDIYYFELPSDIQPNNVVSVKGIVRDKNTNEFLKAAIQIIDLATNKTYKTLTSDEINGQFLITLPIEKNYAFQVNLEDYLPFSENFSLVDFKTDDLLTLEAEMIPISKGNTFILKNVFFAVNEYELQNESTVELDILVQYLQDHPTLKIEIGGHTDSDGSSSFNQTLSKNRAKAVWEYLVGKGIEASRISYKGYGDTQPLVPNSSPENKAKNRRTAFTIL